MHIPEYYFTKISSFWDAIPLQPVVFSDNRTDVFLLRRDLLFSIRGITLRNNVNFIIQKQIVTPLSHILVEFRLYFTKLE